MNEDYRVRMPVLQNIVFVLVSLMLLIVLRAVLPESAKSEQPVYLAISFLVLISVIVFLVWGLAEINVKVTATESGITRATFFRAVAMRWDEIVELGRIRKGWGRNAAWRCYVRSRDVAKPVLIFGSDNTNNIGELLMTVLRCSNSPRVVQVWNDSGIPFLKRQRIEEWTITA